MVIAAVARAAPVEPAETNAETVPSLTNRAATVTEASGFSRIARAASSCIPMTSEACTIGK